MARIRTIKPEFCTSEKIVECSPNARLLFVTMWCFCDDAGRHPLSWRRIKMECFPGDSFTEEMIKEWICELWAADLVECYEYRGKPVLQVKTWEKHQRIERPSYKYGPLDDEEHPLPFPQDSTIDPRAIDERSTIARSGMEWNGMEGNGREGKGVGSSVVEESTTEPASAPEKPPEEPVLIFPCDGKQKTWNLLPSQVATWSDLYPSVDVLSECRKALAYVQAKGRKTARGMPAYLVSWLNRATDNPRGSPAGSVRAKSRADRNREVAERWNQKCQTK